MTDDPAAILAAFIRDHADVDERLRTHEPDREGRCPVCRGGGDGTGRTVGCNLYRAALRARAGGRKG